MRSGLSKGFASSRHRVARVSVIVSFHWAHVKRLWQDRLAMDVWGRKTASGRGRRLPCSHVTLDTVLRFTLSSDGAGVLRFSVFFVCKYDGQLTLRFMEKSSIHHWPHPFATPPCLACNDATQTPLPDLRTLMPCFQPRRFPRITKQAKPTPSSSVMAPYDAGHCCEAINALHQPLRCINPSRR